jgi:hypothetical protein
MKKIYALMLMMLLCVNLVTGTFIQEPYHRGYQENINEQYYTVVFDNEGQASVVARLNFVNFDEEDLKEILLEFPGYTRIINIFQEVYESEEVCQYYEEVCTEFENGDCVTYIKKCSKFYTQQVYPPKYIVVNSELENEKHKLNLPEFAKPGESVNLIIYYKVDGFVDKGIVNKFNFQTIKSNFDVNNVRVATNVVNGLFMEDVDSEVNYQPNFGVLASSYDSAKFESEELYSVSRNIGYYGYSQTGQFLDPWESFTVSGKYTEYWLAFHWIKIVSVIAFFGMFVFGTYLGFKKLNKKKSKFKSMFGLGVGSAISIIVLGYLGRFFLELLPYGIPYQTRNLISGLVVLTEAVSILFLLFGPSIYVGAKQGLEKGVITFGITVATLIALGILSIIFLLISGGVYY